MILTPGSCLSQPSPVGRANASVLGVNGISLTSGALAGFIVDPYLYARTDDRSIASDRVTLAARGRCDNRFLHTALTSRNPTNMRAPTSRVVITLRGAPEYWGTKT
jgi:hypothetical protein